MDLFELLRNIINPAQEAPPQAPEPAEVPHADPQREGLRNEVHALLRERVREHCERGKGRIMKSSHMY